MSSPRCVTRRKGRTVLNPRRIRKIRRRRRRRRRRAAAASADPSNRRRRHHCWGSTRVFSPLLCVEREERKRVRYLHTKIKFFIRNGGVVLRLFLSFLERRRGCLSLLFKTWWLKFRFLGCTTANKQGKKSTFEHIKNVDREEKEISKNKKTRTNALRPTLSCVLCIFLAYSSFILRSTTE